MTVAGQAFILCAVVFVLSFAAIAAFWFADRWRRGSGPQWTTTPKGPDTKSSLVNLDQCAARQRSPMVMRHCRAAVRAVSGAARFFPSSQGGLAFALWPRSPIFLPTMRQHYELCIPTRGTKSLRAFSPR